MSDVLNKRIVLSLNRNWQPIDHYSVKKAILSMTSGLSGDPPLLGMDLRYEVDADGEPGTVVGAIPTAWDEWVKLPVRPYDLFIETAKARIRVPTVVLARNYAGMPTHRPRANSRSVYDRDKGICQVTGRYVGRKGGNLDHVKARSKGGKDTFGNLVWMDKDLNSKKGDKSLEEMGWKLIRQPTEPKAVPRCVVMTEVRHPSWAYFLVAKDNSENN